MTSQQSNPVKHPSGFTALCAWKYSATELKSMAFAVNGMRKSGTLPLKDSVEDHAQLRTTIEKEIQNNRSSNLLRRPVCARPRHELSYYCLIKCEILHRREIISSLPMSRKIALAYVGSIVPDGAEFRNSAFSPAGQMYQANLLFGLKRVGLDQIEIFACMPIPSFPGGRFWVQGHKAELAAGLPLRLVSFLDILFLKQLMIGSAICIRLLRWAWRNRANKRVILTYNLTVPPGLFTLLAAKISGTTAIAALCDVYIPGELVPKNILTIVDFWLHRRLTPHFDGFIVASDAIAQDFCTGRPTVRIEGGLS